MKKFMDDDFLLETDTAKYLYHNHAKKMPIYDYHCHLPIKEIYENRHFENITKLWLVDGTSGDHYKWRAMRNNGVEEKYITGDASDFEKFLKWSETIPYTIGNPLYHWTHLELRRYFNIYDLLSGDSAEEIYKKMNIFLLNNGTKDIINMSNVDTLCTTDDPTDSLEYHIALKEDKEFKTHVYPAFRPDKVLYINREAFKPYIEKLSSVVKYDIVDLDTLEKALKERIDFFNSVGCRISDHSFEEVLYLDSTREEVNDILIKALKDEPISNDEVSKYFGYIICFLGREYKRVDWVQQYHIKALRNNNSRMMKKIGPDTGFDSINDGFVANQLSKILDNLDSNDELPKTILYSLNPNDLELLGTLGFTHTEDGIPGKVQLGSAWWFNDQKDGMEKQLCALSNLGLLSRFVGMLTDSRSFLSYTRHEYFRRILCNFIGNLVENGEYPNNLEFLGQVVEDICFNNAKKYFDNNK